MKELTVDQKLDLVEALLACDTIRDHKTRATILSFLPHEIRDNIREHEKNKVHVTNILTTCLEHSNGIDSLLRVIRRFEEESSRNWQKLWDLWERICKPEDTKVPDTNKEGFQELLDALLNCETLNDPEVRQTVADLLPPEVRNSIQADARISSIVSACRRNQYPESFELLLKAIFAFEGKSDAWQKLVQVWSNIRPPKYPNLSGQEFEEMLTAFTDYSRLGEHLCIDRRWECKTFDLMRARAERLPRLLVFEVPEGKGKSFLMKRFNYVCKIDVLAGKQILYAKVDFRDRPLTPKEFVCVILNTFLKNAKTARNELLNSNQLSSGDNLLEESYKRVESQLKELDKKIKVLSGGQQETETAKGQFLEKIADELASFFSSEVKGWTIVIIVDTFEKGDSASSWLLQHFIPNIKIPDKTTTLDNLILVLSGCGRLSSLKRSDDNSDVVFRDTLEPLKYQDDCQRLAELKYGLKIDKELAEYLIKESNGDFQSIDKALSVKKKFPKM